MDAYSTPGREMLGKFHNNAITVGSLIRSNF